MYKIEHIGIAVKSLKEACRQYELLLGTAAYKIETVEEEGVRTAFFRGMQHKIELLESLNEDSPVSRFIKKRGEGIHHIAFEVNDLIESMEKFKKAGFLLLNETPKQGADNKLVCFIHPKSAHGVLIELCQENPL